MSRSRFVSVVVLALVALNVTAMAGAQEAPEVSSPRATLGAGSGEPGTTVLVVGENWPASSVAQVQLCGNQALNGSADCLRAGAVTQGTDEQGNWNAELPIAVPPTPCPCVVYVTTTGGTAALRLPFEVLGVPIATPQSATANVAVYTVTDVELSGGPTLWSLLGGSGERTLSLTVANTGNSVITTLPVEVRLGEGDATAEVVATRSVGPLTPGQSTAVEIPVSVPALTFGTTTVEATIGSGSQIISRSASFTSYPWLLMLVLTVIAIGLVVAGAALLARRERPAPTPGDDELVASPRPPPPSLSPAPAAAGLVAVGAAGTSTDLPPSPLDAQALEDDLADELGRVLASVGTPGPDDDTDLAAASIAAEVAAVVGARHHLGLDAVQALATDLRESLALELGSVVSGVR